MNLRPVTRTPSMRRRLLVSTLVGSVVVLTMLAVPLGLVAAELVRQNYDHRLLRNAQTLGTSVADRLAHHEPVDAARLAALVPLDRWASVVVGRGPAFSAGTAAGAQVQVRVSEPFGRVTVAAPLSVLHREVTAMWLAISGAAALAAGLAVALAQWQAARLSRPLRRLSAVAARLGSGDVRPDVGGYGVAELELLAATLRNGAAELRDRLEREQRFARDASHQLRTPLTSLTLRLERTGRLTSDPAVAAEVAAALEQVERLTGVVATLLASRRGAPAVGPSTPVGDLLAQQWREWAPAFDRAGRRLAVAPAPAGLLARAPVGAVGQVLATLVENALLHGGGTVTVAARREGGHVVVEVADEGPGVPAGLAARIFQREVSGGSGSGLGLPLARSVVQDHGGRLELTQQLPCVFTVFLPVAEARESAALVSSFRKDT